MNKKGSSNVTAMAVAGIIFGSIFLLIGIASYFSPSQLPGAGSIESQHSGSVIIILVSGIWLLISIFGLAFGKK